MSFVHHPVCIIFVGLQVVFTFLYPSQTLFSSESWTMQF